MNKRCPHCRKTYDPEVEVCPDDGATLTVPRPLDPVTTTALATDYRILDWLGSGGMGAVYLAEQLRVGNRKVALKVLHRKFSEDEEFTTRFQNEAASTGRINHPNVITIYESKQASDGTLYIAMEYVEGESLTEHLRRRGRLPVPEAIEVVSQSCKALQAAHRLGIIHRDIKPDNIMLARDIDGAVHVKILDFGIAKLKDTGGHTVTGSVLGTPAYMSYEQASGLSSDKLDGRSDIYSLGLVAYATLVGHPPFQADTAVGYITKHLNEAPPAIREQRADVPAPVEAAVLKALEKARDRRYATAGDFAAALRAAAAPPAPAPARPAGPVPDAARPAPPPRPARVTTRVPPSPPVPAPAAAGVAPRPVGPPVPPPARPAMAAPRPSFPTETPLPPVGRAAPDAEPGHDPTGENLAAMVWGVRVLVSWGLGIYAVVFLILFAWQVVGGLLPSWVVETVAVVGLPVLDRFGGWMPTLQVGELDLIPLILAVALFVARPHVTGALARLETRWRTGAAAGGATR